MKGFRGWGLGIMKGFSAWVREGCTYMGSALNTLSRSLYKRTYLVAGVSICMFNKRRHATRAR